MNAIFTKRTLAHSLSSRLTLLTVLASGLTLVFACAAFIVNDGLLLRESRVRELNSVAEVVALNSAAALAFDQVEAGEKLLASLSDHADITAARLLDAKGELFASYAADSEVEFQTLRAASEIREHSFATGGGLQVTMPVFDHGEHLGTLQLQTKAGGLAGLLPRYSGIAAGVLLASLLCSIVLGTRLKGIVSQPLLRLAIAVKRMKAEGERSSRVGAPSAEEISELHDEVNAMLARVDVGDAALHPAYEEPQDASVGRQERSQARAQRMLQAREEVDNSVNRLRAISQAVRGAEFTDLDELFEVVNEQRDDLAGFVETDPRGKRLPRDLIEAGRGLARGRDSVLQDLDALAKHIDRIKDMVAAGQEHAAVADGEVHPSA